jgi:hypothetical protein
MLGGSRDRKLVYRLIFFLDEYFVLEYSVRGYMCIWTAAALLPRFYFQPHYRCKLSRRMHFDAKP